MCANHIDMIAHTPAFFTELGTTRIYVECSTAGPSHVCTLLCVSTYHYIEDKLVMRNVIDNMQCFYTMVLPHLFITQILRAAYDELGHNGTTRTYMLVHRL